MVNAAGDSRSVQTWTVALTSLAFFLVQISLLVVVTALPAIRHDLRASLSTLGWVLNAYGLAFGAGVITAAAIGDRLGRVKVFTAGLAVFTVASAIGGLAQDTTVLIASRTLQGLDWHWTFWPLLPVGVILTILSPLFLRESKGAASDLDIVGVVLITLGALGLTWAVVRGNDAGWSSGEVLGTGGAGALLILGFAFWQSRARSPLLPPRLFRSVTFVGANVTSFLLVGTLLGSAFLIIQYFQFVLRLSPLDAGIHWLPSTATPIVIAPIAGALSDRIGRRPLMALGMLVAGIGLAWTGQVATATVDYVQLIVPMILVGAGVSMALPTSPAAALGAVSPADLGKASGVNSTLQRFGGVFGVAIASAVFASYGHIGTPDSFTAGFRPAMGWLAAFAIVGAISALAVRARRTSPAVTAPEQPMPASTE